MLELHPELGRLRHFPLERARFFEGDRIRHAYISKHLLEHHRDRAERDLVELARNAQLHRRDGALIFI